MVNDEMSWLVQRVCPRRFSWVAGAGVLAAALLSTVSSYAWPLTDECARGSGCIALASGGNATFNFTANWDVDTHTQNGQLSYTDSTLGQGGVSLNSSTLIDYSVLSQNSRAFAYALSGGDYAEARLFVTDNGQSGDTFQIQLLDAAGTPVYDTLAQPVRTDCGNGSVADCGGGVIIGSCVVPSPCQLQVSAGCSLPNGSPSGDSCSVTGDSGQVTFYYTIQNGGTTSVSLGGLSASDSFGALDLSTLGSGMLAPGQQVTVSVTESVSGPFPFVNTVNVSGGSGQCSDMASVTVNQVQPPSGGGQDCDDFVTGGGWILQASSGAKANFGVHAGIRNGAFWGGLNYLDHSSGLHVKSTEVTGYTHTGDVCRQITFNAQIDGDPGTAIVTVCDNGEPGRNDTFEIKLSNGYKAGGDLGGARPGGGNIQLHKSKCKDNGPKDNNGHQGSNGGDSKNGNNGKNGDNGWSNNDNGKNGKGW